VPKKCPPSAAMWHAHAKGLNISEHNPIVPTTRTSPARLRAPGSSTGTDQTGPVSR
jgi:hypothetical protein